MASTTAAISSMSSNTGQVKAKADVNTPLLEQAASAVPK